MTAAQAVTRHHVVRAVGRAGMLYVRRHPFSVVLAVTVLATGFVFSLPQTDAVRWLAAGPVTTARDHLWWTPVTALLVPGSPLDAVLAAALAVTVMAYVERLIGTARTMLVYVGVGVVAILAGIGVHILTIFLGTPLLLLARPGLTFDPATGIFGVVMTGSAFAPVLFRRRIRVIGFAVALTFALYAGDQDSIYRVLAALFGLGLGAVLRRDMPVVRTPSLPRPHGLQRASYGEVRTLVAAVVAITGIGPVIVLLSHTLTGPLALVVSGLATVDHQEAFEACATYFRSACGDPADIHVVAHGVGGLLLSLVPVAWSLVAAWGLRTGRRAAWVMAVVVNVATLVVIAGSVGLLGMLSAAGLERVGERFALSAALAVGVQVAVVVVLWVTRRRFDGTVPRAAVRRFVLTTAAAGAVTIALWIVAVAVRGHPVVPLGIRDVYRGLIRLFLPAGFARGLHGGSPAAQGVLGLVSQWAGVLFWIVVLAAAARMLRAATRRVDPDRAQFRRLLRTTGGGTMSFMGTWSGVSPWIDDAGAVAYRLVGTVALVVGDPVCRPEDRRRLLDGFLAFCDRNGWTPVFYSIHEAFRSELDRRGWHDVSVGEETLVRPRDLDFAGGRWKRVRQALAKAERLHVQAVWTRWDDLSSSLAAQIEALSEQWVAEKALPELGFTLGGLAELRDPDVALLLAVDEDGILQAVTSWLPSWCDGQITGWTLDFMRRSDRAMPEIMVFLIAAAALRLKADGVDVMSLSGAPLVFPEPEPGRPVPPVTPLRRVLTWLADVLEPVYGFRSLFGFKQKFHPELQTLHLSYRDVASLPAAAWAILRAYLPGASPRQTLALARSLSVRRG